MFLSVKTPLSAPKIIDLFAVLQECLSKILKNKEYTDQFAKITLTKWSVSQGKFVKKLKGDYQKEIKHITGNPLKGKIPWGGDLYNYVCDNIIHLIVSHNDQITIWHCLKKNNFKINDNLYDLLDQAKVQQKFISHAYLKTLIKAKSIDFPNHKKFIMDFSVDNHQVFTMDDHLGCTIRLHPTKRQPTKKQKARGMQNDLSDPAFQALHIQMYLPAYIRKNLMTGKIAKPLIFWDFQTNEPVLQIAYEIQPPKRQGWHNILGIDLGKVKYYSGVVIDKLGHCSPEYVPTPKLQQLADKAWRLKDHIDSVYTKNQRAFLYNRLGTFFEPWTNRQRRRQEDYYLAREKLTRIKKYMAKLAAAEIIAIALKHHCKEIHMENLHWLHSRGGKWNYSEVQKQVELLAQEFGIKFYRINCAHTSYRHPLTGEIGQIDSKNKRYIYFKEANVRYDRDHLAAINIALVQPGHHKNKEAALKENTTTQIKRVSRHAKAKAWRKNLLKQSRSKDKIVLCSLGQRVLPSGKKALLISSKLLTNISDVLINNIASNGFQKLIKQKVSEFAIY